jgi:predicted nucleotidyltransferase
LRSPVRKRILSLMTLLQKRDLARRQRRLEVLADTRRDLRAALTHLVPGSRVILFGSLTKPGIFNDRSDVDLALEAEPPGMDALHLTAELTERLGRPVDVVLLEKCRFRRKIIREGEVWTP